MDTPAQNTNPTPPSTPAGATGVPPGSQPAAASPAPITSNPVQTPPLPSEPPVEKKGFHLSSILIIVVLIGILLAGLFFASKFFQSALKEEQTIADTTQEQNKELVIGTDATYPPMEFQDEKGNLVGFDIDLGNRIAKELGVTPHFKVLPWDDVFAALEDGDVDIIMSSVTITDERKEKYDFSAPYFNAGQVLITKKENKAAIDSTQLQGKKIGVQKETTSEKEAARYTSDELVIRYTDYIEAAASLSAGLIDTVMIDLTGAKGVVDKNPDLVIASDPLTNEHYGVVIKKGDTETQTKINDALSSLRERGILDNIKQQWFQ